MKIHYLEIRKFHLAECKFMVYISWIYITAGFTNNETDLESKSIICNYYIALSHKDWELPNARIWLAEMDIDRGLDFPI